MTAGTGPTEPPLGWAVTEPSRLQRRVAAGTAWGLERKARLWGRAAAAAVNGVLLLLLGWALWGGSADGGTRTIVLTLLVWVLVVTNLVLAAARWGLRRLIRRSRQAGSGSAGSSLV